ncbi:type 1 glutamine amidotransferase [Microbacterium sp. C5A9]|uniref:type 1 glutamine amidotransferase n=1 Tax=Microbacterium sp. C5A9 TaxID=2736663 RepID=UPI001F527A3F|nr:type 1 glutamine amidotransferase [Microbacterium sp. C5A9]MCI1017325.1 type 1 glutamine amidotransferase [Microbacterium sp. C5A9]
MPDSSAPRRPTLLVIQPDAKDDLERLGVWIAEEGVDVTVVRPFDGDEIPVLNDVNGLVVLGGSMGATDVADFPWLERIKERLREAVATELPTLGICLGAQLLADATGGTVLRGDAGLESGVVAVDWAPEAEDDPLVYGLPRPLLAGAMHFDGIVSLPEDAVLLGTGEKYRHQVFRLASAWGVQFHPEISPARFESWRPLIPEEHHSAYDIQTEEFKSSDSAVKEGSKALAERFANIVRTRAKDDDSLPINPRVDP